MKDLRNFINLKITILSKEINLLYKKKQLNNAEHFDFDSIRFKNYEKIIRNF